MNAYAYSNAAPPDLWPRAGTRRVPPDLWPRAGTRGHGAGFTGPVQDLAWVLTGLRQLQCCGPGSGGAPGSDASGEAGEALFTGLPGPQI